MSAVFNDDAAKILSATLTGPTITVQTHRRLITCRVKFTTIDALDIVTELGNGSNLIQNVNVQTGQGTEGFFTPDTFTTEWAGTLAGESTGSWQLLGCGMPPNSNGASLTLKHYRDASSATVTNTGTADTGNMMNLGVGHGFLPPNMRFCELAIWLTANQAADDAIVSALYNGGSGKYANAIGDVATPAYYWRLFSDENAWIGSPGLSNAGPVTFDGDNPTLIGPVNALPLLGVGGAG